MMQFFCATFVREKKQSCSCLEIRETVARTEANVNDLRAENLPCIACNLATVNERVTANRVAPFRDLNPSDDVVQ